MFTFIAESIGSLLVLLALAAIVSVILFFHVRGRRQGRSSCGSGCASCPMAGKCHKGKPRDEA